MKRRLISLVLLAVMLAFSVLNVSAYYRPGVREYDIEAKYVTDSKNVKLDGNEIVVEGDGYISYDYFTTMDVNTLDIIYENSEGASVSVDAEGDRVMNYSLPASGDKVTHTFYHVQRYGDNRLTLTFKGKVKIKAVRLIAAEVKGFTDFARQDVAISENEWAISTAVLIKTDTPIIMVNGGKRFVNSNDTTEKPILANGTTYLPIKTLARALGYYHEEFADKNYALLRYEQTTYTYRDGKMYKQEGHNEKTAIDILPIAQNGTFYMPVRYFAEEKGETVEFKDGIIIIDGRNAVKDIVNSVATISFIKSEFEPYAKETVKGTTYYVAQTFNASDDNPGTIDAPFKTLNKAGEIAKAGDTVIIREGIYRELFAPKNNGTESSPIIFKAADGENVTISAAEEVSGFVDMGNGLAAVKMPWDLGKGRNQIFINNECVVEARYPNGPAIEMSEAGEELSGLFPTKGDFLVPDDDKNVVLSDTLLNQEENDYWRDAIYVSMHGYGWTMCAATVKSSEKGKLHLTDLPSRWWYDPATSDKMDFGYLTGTVNCIDLPGEWAVQNGILYMMPPEGVKAENIKVDIKKRQLVMDLSESKFVRVEGMNTIGGSVLMNNSEMCVLDNMNMRYISHFTYCDNQRDAFLENGSIPALKLNGFGSPQKGEVAMYIGGKNNQITNSVIDHSACAGLLLVGMHEYVENNIVSNCGYMSLDISGITIGPQADKSGTEPRGGHAVYNNSVYNCGRSPFHVTLLEAVWPGDYRWPIYPYEIAYNDFHDGMLASLDTGITYENGVNCNTDRLMSNMHHNYVYYTLPETNPYSFGLYHDGNVEGIDTYDNIVFTTEKGVIYSSAYCFTNGTLSPNNMWNNRSLTQDPVSGGPKNLRLDQFPYQLPFYAGSYIGEEPFMRNYNAEYENNSLLFARDNTLGGEAALLKDGTVLLGKAGDYVEFKNVDLGEEGKNAIDVYYKGDRFWPDTRMEIGFGDSIDTAEFYPIQVSAGSNRVEQLDTFTEHFDTKTGRTNVYLKNTNGIGLSIEGISFAKKDITAKGHDGACIYGGNFDRIDRMGNEGKPEPVYEPQDKPFVKGAWNGCILRYQKVKIPPNAKVFYVVAGTKEPYHDQTIEFSYNKIGEAGNVPIATHVTTNNGWYADDDYVYYELDEAVPEDTVDLYLKFSGAGKTCNLYSFGFLSEIPADAQ